MVPDGGDITEICNVHYIKQNCICAVLNPRPPFKYMGSGDGSAPHL